MRAVIHFVMSLLVEHRLIAGATASEELKEALTQSTRILLLGSKLMRESEDASVSWDITLPRGV